MYVFEFSLCKCEKGCVARKSERHVPLHPTLVLRACKRCKYK